MSWYLEEFPDKELGREAVKNLWDIISVCVKCVDIIMDGTLLQKMCQSH